MALWKDGAFVSDGYAPAVEGEPMPDGPVLVPLARLLAEGDLLLARNAPLGASLAPADRVDGLAPWLDRLSLVALLFPAFSDGRAFSQARLLRERHGYRGTLRAVGDVLFDRIAYMRRCGFDELDIHNGPTLEALRAGRVPGAHEFYQPTGRDGPAVDPLRPWRRLA